MANINGTSNNDTLQGTNDDDTIQAFNGQDLVSGEGGDDSILGGGGDDTIFGDVGEGTAPGNDATPLVIDINNLVSPNTGNVNAGASAVYKNVAQLEDGTQVSARLILVSKSDDRLTVDLNGGDGFEILMNGRGSGDTADFRMEFFIPDTPNATTGTPVALNSTATINDLDRNSPGDQEAVIINASSFSAFAVSDDSVLNVVESNGQVTAEGRGDNDPDDQEAWFSASFENRTFIEFTLESRNSNSGFSFSGDLIDDAVVTPIEAGDDTIDGGSGQDVIFGQGGNDSLSGGQGDDVIDGGEGDDFLDGGQGQDELIGGAGNDTLVGGTGDDTLLGGAGEDLITLGPDNDRAEGGTGSDRFIFDGLGNHNIIGGEDADGSDIDVIDLTGVNANVLPDGPNSESGTIELLDDNGNVARRVTYSEIEQIIICFTPGTRIATPQGEVPVERLQAGDRVFTRDNGAQTLRWVGRRDLSPDEMRGNDSFQPVLIRMGALGKGLPERDMLVSPQHRMLVNSDLAEVMFEEREVLIAAKHLTGLDGVDQVRTGAISYLHLMFDQHEVVLADGAWSESFQPGDHSLRGIGAEQREEVLTLFPELDTLAGLDNYGAARVALKRHEAEILVDRLK
ncbi:Hint domain-containing protein [Tateyamaria sp. ANG-S1]|uniref:Hint domain-containing protein n=1 Tax=Tateyamaria sp. ANG-S1 TaxID=1577905 RepID=UPI00057EE7D0|nr:Hint domain-containing protein [Tateyamaria sp. ANG-S1]KIC48989.1 type I secretion protein [Tateyamaria sp. ANG-S1]